MGHHASYLGLRKDLATVGGHPGHVCPVSICGILLHESDGEQARHIQHHRYQCSIRDTTTTTSLSSSQWPSSGGRVPVCEVLPLPAQQPEGQSSSLWFAFSPPPPPL